MRIATSFATQPHKYNCRRPTYVATAVLKLVSYTVPDPYGKFPHVNVMRFHEEVLEWWATLDFPGITAKSRKCPGYFPWTLSLE